MSTSAYYSFIEGPSKRGPLDSSQALRKATRQPLNGPTFANSFSTSISSLNQSSSLTPVSSANSSSSDSVVSSINNNDHSIQPLNTRESANSTRRRSLATAAATTTSSGLSSPSPPQLCHSYTLHSLEPKPFKPFKTNSDYLEAMKEDLAEWLNRLYPDLDLTSDNFLPQLETGAIICRHANNVTQTGRNFLLEQQAQQLSLSVDVNLCISSGACSGNSDTSSASSGNFVNQHYDGQLASTSSTSSTNQRDQTNGSATSEHSFASTVGSISSNRRLNQSPDNVNYVNGNLTNSPIIMGSSNSSLAEDLAHGYSGTTPGVTTIVTGSDKDMIDRALINSDKQPTPRQRHHQQLQQLPTSMALDSSPCSFSGSSSCSKSSPPFMEQSQTIRPNNVNWFLVKPISYKSDANPGTFFARDNICQFILWCRSLNIIECLLFETDDLVDRKNEKSFILCLLEVARIGFKVGMPTPLIIQLEHEIDREIENDAELLKELEEKQNRVNNNNNTCKLANHSNNYNDCNCDEITCSVRFGKEGERSEGAPNSSDDSYELKSTTENLVIDVAKEKYSKQGKQQEYSSAAEEEKEGAEEDSGPKPQVITNDLLSLHERVVQLLCQCTCPTQFPMVRVGDNGKYKVGDKLIIFVRILRRHIMVRVGGGWQELSEFLRVKDPCRSKLTGHNYNHHHHNHQFQQHQHSSSLYSPASSQGFNRSNMLAMTKSRLPEMTPGQHMLFSRTGALGGGSGPFRNTSGQRMISSSASMGWLSNSAKPNATTAHDNEI